MESRAELIFNLFNALGAVGMTWWVSAIVLCSAVIGGAWAFRNDLREMSPATMLQALNLVRWFFYSIVTFGTMVILGCIWLGINLNSAYADSGACRGGDALIITVMTVGGYAIGTSSFLLCLKALKYVQQELLPDPELTSGS